MKENSPWKCKSCFCTRALVKVIFEALKCLWISWFGGLEIGLDQKPYSLRAQRLKTFKIALQDWNFQARLKISSEPPTKPHFLWGILKVEIEIFKRDWNFKRAAHQTPFFVGNSEGRDWNAQARLKFQAWLPFVFNLWALRLFKA